MFLYRLVTTVILTVVSLVVFENSAYAQKSKQDSILSYMTELEKRIAGKEKESAESVFKNIQTLKGIPAGRFLKIMEMGFSKSLGVNCDHCHDVSAWEKDEKKSKNISRKMWVMADNIRKELGTIVNEKATINCTTCHRGNLVPAINLK